MKKIQKYESLDGTCYDTEEACLKADYWHTQTESVLALFKRKEDIESTDEGAKYKGTSHFANGAYFILQDPAVVKLATQKALDLFMEYSDHHWFKSMKSAMRITDGAAYILHGTSLNRLASFFMHLDRKNRLWGQPYYAINGNSKAEAY